MQNHRLERGFSLIEGMAATVVLALGVISLFSFQGTMLSAGADSMAGSEALQYAEEKMAELRTQAKLAYTSQAAFLTDTNNVFNGNRSQTGSNADFTITWSSSNQASPARKQTTVTVSWVSPEGTQTVSLGSLLSWVDSENAAAIALGYLPGGGSISAPQGTAQYGDNIVDYQTGSIPGNSNTHSDGTNDGTKTYNNNGSYELIDTDTGIILLSAPGELSSISGRIYVELVGGSPVATLTGVYSVAPDISICITSNDVNETGTISDSSGNDTYAYINYTCYMGAGWHGNIGVVLDGVSIGSNDGFCVGDPAEIDNGDDDSKHPQLSATRVYRGYSPLTDSAGNNQYDANGNRLYFTQGIGSGSRYQLHDFLLATLPGGGGTRVDSDCQAELSINGTSEFSHNVGPKFCLSASCPATWPVGTGEAVSSASTLTISGTISGGSLSGIVTSAGDSCTVDNANNVFSCSVDDLGNGWSGYIEAMAADGYTLLQSAFSFNDIENNITGVNIALQSSSATKVLTISGAIDKANSVTLSAITLSDGGTCTLYDTTSYSCQTNAFTDTWTGTMTISHDKTLCPDGISAGSSGVITSNNTITYTGTSVIGLSKNLTLRNNLRQCP